MHPTNPSSSERCAVSLESVEPTSSTRPVAEVVSLAREARRERRPVSQETVDELTSIVHRAVSRRPGLVEKWAKKAVAETGQGNGVDKVEKIERVVESMFREMEDQRSVGILGHPDDDPLEIGKPVGVVGAHTPSTNCAATPVALALTALKGGNALVVSPSPYAVETCDVIVGDLQDELEREGFPPQLVQSLTSPIRKDRTEELLQRADAIQVTGSPAQVEMGQTCGTPNYSVGAGNTVGIIDPSAIPRRAAEHIAHSASFDNGLVCVCMSNVLVPPEVAEPFETELAAAGGYICSGSETDRLRATLFDGDSVDSESIGQPAATIASSAGFGGDFDDERFLVAPFDEVALDDPLVRENLSPVVTLYRVASDEAVETTNRITRHQGSGHSCAVYGDRDRAVEIAERVDVCRIVRNQSSIGLCIGDETSAETSLSLGCGTWGGNQTDGNITYERFTNTTTHYEGAGSPF